MTDATVTITVEGSKPVAVFPNGLETRVELHPGDKATFDTEHLVLEPVMLVARGDDGTTL